MHSSTWAGAEDASGSTTDAAAKSGNDTEAASEKEADAGSTESAAGGYQLESFTPIDNDECLITIKDIVDDPIWGTSINVAMENKSADKTYMFSANDIIINGVQCDGYFAKEVAPGKKANDSISLKFSDSGLTENGITEYTDIEDAAVNGFMADPYFARTIRPGACRFTSASWMDSTLEENNITEVEEIEFALRAYDNNDWMGDDLARETVTLK